ncbi:MAG TPA: Wadjet anti-phage system protein JetD domain-containing protein [Anaerolineae bacterium]|nr:Wadjet anti-phage system protein JetD domain-containing protein [Anaerolineae bacterium]
MKPPVSLVPSPDVAAVLNNLLDQYERRQDPHARLIRCDLEGLDLPGYYSQLDPEPRQVANEQLVRLEEAGLVRLRWLAGEERHLLEAVVLDPDAADGVFCLARRAPRAAQRARLRDLLLGDRFRLDGWRLRAVNHTLAQLREERSPAPFSLSDEGRSRDLLAALVALNEVAEETPIRAFSARTFNDSKRLESLLGALVRLARRHVPEWRELRGHEVLAELGLVTNPGHLVLAGAWRLVDDQGAIHELRDFRPSVGIPAHLAATVRQVTVAADRVVCVENLAPFYELVRREPERLAALYLGGNPSPACRHLLRCLANDAPAALPLGVWADLDAGGLSILAQVRRLASPRFAPHLMDVDTLEAHAHWAQPLTPGDERRLARLARDPHLQDVRPLIEHMLARGYKLEQEAILQAPAARLIRPV